LLASTFSCLSVCVLLSLLSSASVCVAVGSTSLVCVVRSVSKTLAREINTWNTNIPNCKMGVIVVVIVNNCVIEY